MTKRMRLTDKLVAELEVPSKGQQPIFIYDGGHPRSVRGSGVYITSGHARTFFVAYTAKQTGTQRLLTIGRYPEWSVIQFRERAAELRRLVDAGHDPKAESDAHKEAPTVAQLCDRYLVEHAEKKKRASSVKEDRSLVNQFMLPELGKMRVADVKRKDVEAVFRMISFERNTPCRANSFLILASKMFNLAVQWELRTDNPVRGISKNREARRERYLTDDEREKLMKAIAAHPNREMADCVMLLLLTGARRSEATTSTWDQFDLRAGIWTKPASHTKQGQQHVLPLNSAALDVLKRMKAEIDAGDDTALHLEQQAKFEHRTNCRAALLHRADRWRLRKRSPFLFPAYQNREGCVDELGKAWAKITQAAGLGNMVEKRSKCGELELDRDGKPRLVWQRNFRLHDLRHEHATIAVSAGVPLNVISGLLGHASNSLVTARYGHLRPDVLREASERVGEFIAKASVANTNTVKTKEEETASA